MKTVLPKDLDRIQIPNDVFDAMLSVMGMADTGKKPEVVFEYMPACDGQRVPTIRAGGKVFYPLLASSGDSHYQDADIRDFAKLARAAFYKSPPSGSPIPSFDRSPAATQTAWINAVTAVINTFLMARLYFSELVYTHTPKQGYHRAGELADFSPDALRTWAEFQTLAMLKSGGPIMAVTAVTNGKAHCIWQDEQDAWQAQDFSVDALFCMAPDLEKPKPQQVKGFIAGAKYAEDNLIAVKMALHARHAEATAKFHKELVRELLSTGEEHAGVDWAKPDSKTAEMMGVTNDEKAPECAGAAEELAKRVEVNSRNYGVRGDWYRVGVVNRVGIHDVFCESTDVHPLHVLEVRYAEKELVTREPMTGAVRIVPFSQALVWIEDSVKHNRVLPMVRSATPIISDTHPTP